jgi:glycosyltransferase involved in cell wall biosynthesis
MPEPMTARVALVVIARDEAAHIERLLRSVAPWVDEMLVLDTGSVDDTAQRARACGARVASFAWCDDFAAARNAALTLAAADWHLVLDADEWLIDGGPALQALRHSPRDFVGSVDLLDHFGDGAARVAHQRLSRVLPGPVRYAGCVHEQPQHDLPVRRLAVRVGHDGYLPGRILAKQGRNRHLLEQALAHDPQDSYLWYQLGKDAAVYDDHALAESAFERAARLKPPPRGWWLDLVTRRLFTLKRLGRHADGLALAETEQSRCSHSPDFYFALGDLMLDWAAEQPDAADTLLSLAEQAWRCCLDLGEQPDLPGAVAGRGSVLAAHNLALVLDATGRAPEAQALRRNHATAALV